MEKINQLSAEVKLRLSTIFLGCVKCCQSQKLENYFNKLAGKKSFFLKKFTWSYLRERNTLFNSCPLLLPFPLLFLPSVGENASHCTLSSLLQWRPFGWGVWVESGPVLPQNGQHFSSRVSLAADVCSTRLELSALNYWCSSSCPLPALCPIPSPDHTRLAEASDNNQIISSPQAQCV